MHTQIKSLRLAVAQITATLDDLEEQLAHVTLCRFQECVTVDVPPGFDTVLGYLAKYHPDVLATFDYAEPAATQRDGFWLSHRTRERGLPPFTVEAPPVLREQGIMNVRAYPVALLAQRWG